MEKHSRINKIIILTFVAAISILFLVMIHQFIMAILMAAIFAAIARPLYLRCLVYTKGREPIASLLVTGGIIAVVFWPSLLLIGIVVAQAVEIGQNVAPWVETLRQQPSMIEDYVLKIPYIEHLLPYRDVAIEKSGSMISHISSFMAQSLSRLTSGTFHMIFNLVIMFYVMYYFFMDGKKFLHKIMYYLPLSSKEEYLLLNRFTSVTRATLKSTLIIGILQGSICGLAFAFAGIKGSIFWGTMMAVMSVIPSVGTAIIWLPAVLILLIKAEFIGVAILVVMCGVVAGNLDNVLRPRLVGKDTQMHDLYVLFGTLGGIAMFGIPGIILGPIIAALFITIWDIYGEVFKMYLPRVQPQKKYNGKWRGRKRPVGTDDGR